MISTTHVMPWLAPGWWAEATAWIEGELGRLGHRVTDPIERLHARPWSTVLRVPTERGVVYFKAVGSDSAHEPALTARLAAWRPDVMPTVLATDTTRGWLLMADAGPRLREIIRGDRDLGHWERLLPVYAELQMELVARVDEMLDLGTPDRRLARLPALYAALVEDVAVLRVGQTPGLTETEHQRLRDDVANFAALCEALGAYGIPDSLHHGDFHDANIMAHDGEYLFFDWGDAVVGHPFFSLRTAGVSVEMSLGLPENPPEFERLVDAYLEPWTAVAPRVALRAAFALAYRVSVINGALTWYRSIVGLPQDLQAEYAEPVPALLQEYLGLAG